VNNAGILSLRCALLAIVATLGLVGCAAESADVPSADLVGAVEPEGFTPNSLHALALTRNALIANPDANPLMPGMPLNTASYSDAGPFHDQLRHQDTREMMSYLVSCALSPGQTVSYTETATGTTYGPWEGKLGLCPAWYTGSASLQCQETVSACLLARVNAFGFKIPLSIRGQGATSLATAPSFPTVEFTKNASTISSFVDCTASGPARNCGYVANYVGTCTPGTSVGVGAGVAPPGSCGTGPLGSSVGNTVLRVCNGITGCDHGSSDVLAESGGSCGTTRPSVTFSCPSSGNFAVMSGPQVGGGAGVATPAATLTGGTAYPATEQSVFPWLEGAFFGNLWSPGGLNADIHSGQNHVDKGGNFTAAAPILLSSGSIFLQMFACSGVAWTQADAYDEDRICAGGFSVPTNCAATPKGACSTSMSAVPACPTTHICSVLHTVPGSGDYDDCSSSAIKTWHNPITVYLNQPGDVSLPGGNYATAGTPSTPAPPACP
jgi:hypothetical protein